MSRLQCQEKTSENHKHQLSPQPRAQPNKGTQVQGQETFIHLTEHLIALRLVILDEISSLPEGIASLAEWLRLKTQLWFDDSANNKSASRRAAAQDAPHVDDATRRPIEKAQESGREVEVVDLAIVDITSVLLGNSDSAPIASTIVCFHNLDIADSNGG